MAKISITLPNYTQIVVETEDPDVIREAIYIAMRYGPKETERSGGNAADRIIWEALNGDGRSLGNGGSLDDNPPTRDVSEKPPEPGPEAVAPAPVPTESANNNNDGPNQAEEEFINFCQTSNPLGDMRRVVVAAEGASRFLGTESVGTGDLERLFDLAGWHRPHSFVQTLRNAARSKFRWLERVPGKSGHYTVTDQGRKTALGG